MTTILYAEDNEIVREMTVLLFEQEGHKIIAAKDSKQALEMFQQNQDKISVVITDLDMPEMTGDQLITETRKNSSDIPIYIVTGTCDPDRFNKLLRQGVSACFEKPVSIKKLLDVVSTVTQGRNIV